nr:hypothetical protein Iba_chr11dCG7060 [Ipomoea batatas]
MIYYISTMSGFIDQSNSSPLWLRSSPSSMCSLQVKSSRANASDPVLDATSSISEALAGVTLSASRNSHNSFKEHASVNTAEWPPPAASFLTSPTHQSTGEGYQAYVDFSLAA